MILLVLYEELATYFVKSITTFAFKHNYEVHVIRKEVNREAPFEFDLSNIQIYDRANYTEDQLIELVKKINPDALFCGGWASKIYLKIVSQYKGKIPTVLGFDNKWKRSLKQRLAILFARFLIVNKFDKCFVPGPEQKEFAVKIGFKEKQIAMGVYCCDYDFFYSQYLANKKQKQKCFPKRFIFVGRYYEFKGIKDLWQAFIELQNENPNEWELWCLGTGDIEPVTHPKIKHFGFVQPKNLSKFIEETGVFVLPSHIEPWGVVIHEFAAAGFPIICTNAVGAKVSFVENNFNGYVYKAGDINQLKEVLKKIMIKSDDELSEMAERSTLKARQITPEIWADTLLKLITS